MQLKINLLVPLAVGAIFSGCASRYPNWEYVRIEFEVPSEKCEYKIQEACHAVGARCYNWYKQRATVFQANTVVLTKQNSGQHTEGKAFLLNGSGGSNLSSDPTFTGLADYYYCPAKNVPKTE